MNYRNIIGFAVGPLSAAGLGLLTVPLIAGAFSPEDVGRLNILQVTVSFCLIFLTLGLDQAYVREFHESCDRAALLKICIIPGTLLLVVAIISSIFFRVELSRLLFGIAQPIYYWLTLVCVAAVFFSRFLSLVLRMQERGLEFSMSQAIPKALLLALVSGIIWSGISRDFLILQLTFMTSVLAVLIVILCYTGEQWYPAISAGISYGQLRALLKFGGPLVFSGLGYWGLVATSSIVLRALSTFSELGVYSIATSLAGVATVFQAIFSVVWAPIVYRWVSEQRDLARVHIVAQQALAAICGILLICGMFSWVADYLLPAKYADVKYLVPCAIIPPLLYTLSEVTCVGITISRRTMLTVWVTLAALCVNVLLNLLFARNHGAAGAVMANSVAYMVFFVARTEASAYAWRSFPRAKMYVIVGISVVLCLSTVTLAPLLPFHYALVWLGLVPLVAWSFRGELADATRLGCQAIGAMRIGRKV